MHKRRQVKKRVKMSKFERLIYTFAIVLAISAPVTIVFSQATLSQINFEVEKVKKEIKEQTKTNESLSMKINELASLDKIEEIAEEEGLSYNNDNIKTVDEN
ncbi:MAG TPA: cell division protein FtsL [Candidatus Onthousia faecigallinarum]|nr:cell division protein FtsL [Candidatus Onthousia faecigallinarum]